MGNSDGNYQTQINEALKQANMPKSPLSQQLSGMLGSNASGIFNGLGQGQNAFPGLYSGAGTPGSVQNGGGFQFQNPGTPQQTPQQGSNNSPPTGGYNPPGQPGQSGYFTPTDQPSFNAMSMLSPQNPTPTQQGGSGGVTLGDIPIGQPGGPGDPNNPTFYPPNGTGGNQSPAGTQGLFPQIAQSNPGMQGLEMGAVPQNYANQLSGNIQAPQTGNYNPSAGLLQQVQNSAGGNNIAGLPQSLQQALSNLGNVGGAQLPQNNVGSPNLQAAAPQNVNPGNASLQLGNPNNVNLASANLQTGLPNAQDSAYYDATSQLLGNQYNQGVKDLQARFGAAGGTSRGTPAAFAQSQYAAQALPQLQAALGNVRQQEVGNQLTAQNQANTANLQARGQDLTNSQQNVSNQLTGQNQANNALLTGRGQDINNSQQNVQNLLQSVGLNNNSNLQARQQNIDLAGQQQQGALANQGLVNQGGVDSLNSLASLFGQQGQLNNSLLSNLGNIANNAGQQNLGQNQLSSQSQLGTNQLNSQNINNLLSQFGNFQNNNNQATLGQNQLNAQNSQFNAGQQNSTLQQYMQQLQSANQNQINNQFQGSQNLAQILAQFGLSGIPGGSANVNLGAQSQTGLQQLAGIAGGLGGLL